MKSESISKWIIYCIVLWSLIIFWNISACPCECCISPRRRQACFNWTYFTGQLCTSSISSAYNNGGIYRQRKAGGVIYGHRPWCLSPISSCMAAYLGHKAADKTLSTVASQTATVLKDITEQWLMEASYLSKFLLWTFYDVLSFITF